MLNRFYAWFTRFSLAGEHGGGKGLRKKPLKSETVIYTYVSIIKQHWRKMTKIPPQKRGSHLDNSKFRKKSENVCKKVIILIN